MRVKNSMATFLLPFLFQAAHGQFSNVTISTSASTATFTMVYTSTLASGMVVFSSMGGSSFSSAVATVSASMSAGAIGSTATQSSMAFGSGSPVLSFVASSTATSTAIVASAATLSSSLTDLVGIATSATGSVSMLSTSSAITSLNSTIYSTTSFDSSSTDATSQLSSTTTSGAFPSAMISGPPIGNGTVSNATTPYPVAVSNIYYNYVTNTTSNFNIYNDINTYNINFNTIVGIECTYVYRYAPECGCLRPVAKEYRAIHRQTATPSALPSSSAAAADAMLPSSMSSSPAPVTTPEPDSASANNCYSCSLQNQGIKTPETEIWIVEKFVCPELEHLRRHGRNRHSSSTLNTVPTDTSPGASDTPVTSTSSGLVPFLLLPQDQFRPCPSCAPTALPYTPSTVGADQVKIVTIACDADKTGSWPGVVVVPVSGLIPAPGVSGILVPIGYCSGPAAKSSPFCRGTSAGSTDTHKAHALTTSTIATRVTVITNTLPAMVTNTLVVSPTPANEQGGTSADATTTSGLSGTMKSKPVGGIAAAAVDNSAADNKGSGANYNANSAGTGVNTLAGSSCSGSGAGCTPLTGAVVAGAYTNPATTTTSVLGLLVAAGFAFLG